MKDEYVETTPPSAALDSIANVPKDNAKTNKTTATPTLPLPQPVMQKLTEQYPGWEKPAIAAYAEARAEAQNGSAAIARGDFDGDTRQDVALQFQLGDDVVLVAALQKEDGNYVLEELNRDILFNERGKLKSLYYLFTQDGGDNIFNTATSQEIELPHDAVSVGLENSLVTYLYQNGGFEKINVQD
ncbi:hypothetical protein GCM10028895_47070 [Pontibacter rugosus]